MRAVYCTRENKKPFIGESAGASRRCFAVVHPYFSDTSESDGNTFSPFGTFLRSSFSREAVSLWIHVYNYPFIRKLNIGFHEDARSFHEGGRKILESSLRRKDGGARVRSVPRITASKPLSRST